MTAAIRLSAIAAAVLIVLFFPFRLNAGAYADFKNKNSEQRFICSTLSVFLR